MNKRRSKRPISSQLRSTSRGTEQSRKQVSQKADNHVLTNPHVPMSLVDQFSILQRLNKMWGELEYPPEHTDQEPPSPQRPSIDDPQAWPEYWQKLGQPGRIEPEIDEKRQKYLAKRLTILPDIKQGIYPFRFKDNEMRLSRADIEWLLAVHEGGQGPVNWNDPAQRKRIGLDLRGADLRGLNLSGLPLACIHGGLTDKEAGNITDEQQAMAAVHLEGALLIMVQLQGAQLNGAHLEGANLLSALLDEADLRQAYLIRACLIQADLTKANLLMAHLEEAQLIEADLEEAQLALAFLEETQLIEAHLERAFLKQAHLEGAFLIDAHLEGATFARAYLMGADLSNAHLAGADFRGARLEGANIEAITLCNEKYGAPRLADMRWDNINVTVVQWSQMKISGDEQAACKKKHDGILKDRDTQLEDYEVAVRANRQLAVVLQSQGLNEDAARFAYHAQKLQRRVLWYQRKSGQYLFSLFLSLTSGYGYRLWRGFATYLFVIIGFAAVYYLLGPMAKLSLSPLDAIIFSITSFHGRGFSPGENIGLSNPLTIFAAIEAFVGLIIEVTLIATLTQRFFGK